MSRLARFCVSLEPELLRQFNRLVASEGYPTRSEAVKALIRQALIQKEWIKSGEVAGAITIVYNHHKKGLVNKLIDIEHDFGQVIVSSQHIHLDRHNCLEIVVVKDRANRIRRLVSNLKSVKGVKHCTLVMTTSGKETA
jgi:CopG family nickel-responsive transcriptional regulator